jgi:KDO2-lipid IV(A) lauroyltransferase
MPARKALIVQRIGHYLAFSLVRLVLSLAQALPLSVCQSASRALAWLFCDALGARRQVIDDNLRHAFPELNDRGRRLLARRMWEHLFLFTAEVAHASRKLRGGNYWRYVRFHGEAELTQALLADRPLILVTAHFGNFELASYTIALFGHRLQTVARPLDNPYLDELVNRFRSSCGQTMLSKQSDYERILELLSAGATVTFVADQYAGRKGCWVEFFHRPASAHKAIALLALQHDAPIVVGYCRRLDRPMQFELAIQGTLDPRTADGSLGGVKEVTQWYTTQIEEMVRRAPEQYWWLHRRWKDNRAKYRQAREAARAA